MIDAPAPPRLREFDCALRFGRFSLDPARKLLLNDGRAVRLGGRALDLLIALVTRAGEVVTHEALFAQVWPHTVVVESSVRVHMSALRKALGDGVDGAYYIASLPGRGYKFVMAVTAEDRLLDAPTAEAPLAAGCVPATSQAPGHALPPRLCSVVGREAALAALSVKLQHRRLLTIVGSGGIGKTTVALALAEAVAGRHAEGALFVDLAPLDDPALVPAALAAAIGVPVPAQSSWPTLEATLSTRDLLIVLDNCEHLIAAAATLVERVLRAAPRVRIVTTSREPLEAESETVHRLETLAMPPADAVLGIDDALVFPALRLFVERATASADDFQLAPGNLGAIVRLCRHLDGVPLAIELAAARVGSLGIHALAERLDDVFRLLRRGRRTVMPRHRTLQALLDWSHGLLDDHERRVLYRLSAFRSSFTLEAAAQLASCDRISTGQVMACVLDLVARSLIEHEPGDGPRYRLLFIERLYAWERLMADDDAREIGCRHAACIRDLLACANLELADQRVTVPSWRAKHRTMVADIRAALEWTEGPGGDRLLGAEIVAESGRLLLELGLNDELLERGLDALAAVRASGCAWPQIELRLLTLVCALGGQSLLEGREVPTGFPAQLDELAQRVGSPMQRLSALQAQCVNTFGNGDYPRVIDLAARFETMLPTPDDPAGTEARLIGRRFRALGQHYLGGHGIAWTESEYLLEHASAPDRGRPYAQQPVQVSMGMLQARVLWLQGRADLALQRALDVLDPAEGAHPFSLSQTLALAVIPILLWRGDDERALSFLARLVDHDLAHLQSFWLAWCDSYCRVLELRGLDVAPLRLRLGSGWSRVTAMQSDMLGTLVSDLVGPAQLARVEAGTVGWCAPEILRVHGERLMTVHSQPAQAEGVLQRALDLARRQGARAWELRAASSVAALWQATGRRDTARRLLVDTLAGFDEGLDCADVRRARALLEDQDAVS